MCRSQGSELCTEVWDAGIRRGSLTARLSIGLFVLTLKIFFFLCFKSLIYTFQIYLLNHIICTGQNSIFIKSEWYPERFMYQTMNANENDRNLTNLKTLHCLSLTHIYILSIFSCSSYRVKAYVVPCENTVSSVPSQ